MLYKPNDVVPQAVWPQARYFSPSEPPTPCGHWSAGSRHSQDPYGSLAGTHVGSVAARSLFSLALQTWLMNVQPSELNATSSEICFLARADCLCQIPTALVQLLVSWHLEHRLPGTCPSRPHVQVLKCSRELCLNSRSLVVLTHGPVQRRS